MKNKIKLLIVDDSLTFRKVIEKALNTLTDIEIVGFAHNGTTALKLVEQHHPDIVTLDVELPDMNGYEVLEKIQQFNQQHSSENPIAIIMLSAFTTKNADLTVKCLNAGAFDYITKPTSTNSEESFSSLQRQLTTKVMIAATKTRSGNVTSSRITKSPTPSTSEAPVICNTYEAIVIGVSTGGPKALNELLPPLCSLVSSPILIVQHMPENFTNSLAQHLDRICCHNILEPRNGEIIKPAHVYIAPGDRHMLVRKAMGNNCIVLNDQPPENGCKPAADVLFRSAATIYENKVLALILTGMGSDGTQGLKVMKRHGAYVIAQDETSSVVWGMPGSAVAAGCVDKVLPLNCIPQYVKRMIQRGC